MDTGKLYQILGETTAQLRKGPERTDAVADGVAVTELYMMPSVADADAERPDLEKVDMEFIVVGVDKAKAEARRSELIAILNDWPNPAELAGGPSYIAAGATIGDQGAAFQLFALGKVLGLWGVITPATFGMTGAEARNAAGSGFIMCTGYRPQQAAA